VGDTLLFAAALNEHPCTSLTFSPDGTLLAAGRSNGMVGIWRVETGAVLRHFLHDLLGHPVRAVAFSADGLHLACAGGGHVGLRDLRTGRLMWRREHPAELTGVAFGPRGDCVTTACADGAVRTWTLRGRLAAEDVGDRPAGPAGDVVASTPDGRLRATVEGGELRVWVTLPAH
jgi:WD40 repeat protein